MDPALEISAQQLSKKFESGTLALNHLDLHIKAGDFVSLLGPSGCGKSTLLRLIASLDSPSSGSLRVNLPPVLKNQVPVGFVFQESHLLPWRSVRDNVSLPLELLQAPKDVQHQRTQEVLRLVNLENFSEAFPHELSGGMKMRASLARALVAQPHLLLLDEPFAALDELTRFKLDLELRALWKKLHLTVIFVTHSIFEAAFLSERVCLLSPRPARIVHDERISYSEPRDKNLKSTAAYMQKVQDLTLKMEALG